MTDPVTVATAPSSTGAPSARTPALVITGLRKHFAGRPPVAAVDGVDLEIRPGSITAVLGPSGCGKTTLLRLVAGLETADAGSIVLAGRTVDGDQRVPAHRRGIGLVPQEGALFPHLSVADNIGFGLSRRDRDRAARIESLLELVDLAGMGKRSPHQLSGGQQQRVALARALAPAPTMVLLDEPFAALDAALRVSLRAEVAAVLRRTGATALLVTHDQSEALSMADSVAVMIDGRIRQVGRPDEIYSHPTDLDTARLVGDLVTVDGTIDRSQVRCPLGSCPLQPTWPAQGSVVVGYRPEQIRRSVDGAEGTVQSVSFLGPSVSVLIDLDQARDRCRSVSALWPAHELPAVGERVSLEAVGPPVAVASAR